MPERPLRVLHVFAPGAAGGLESVVQMLVPGLSARGVEVAVSAVLGDADPEPPSVTCLRTAGVTVFSHRSSPRGYLAQWRGHRARVASWRPDIVHTHGYLTDVLAGHAVRGRAARVATAHGFTGGDRKNRFYQWLQLRSYRGFDAVVAVSRTVRDAIVTSGVPAASVALIPNAWVTQAEGLDRQSARAALGLPPDAIIVGWVGRLSREKGADVLLRSIASLANPAIHFSIVGDGQERAALQGLASELGITGRITWHGLVPGAGRLVAAFDLFALSSNTEGTPIALFEAMAAGVPSIATAVGGVPDILSPNEGWLVPSGSPSALAAALHAALGSPAEARARADRARERLLREFAAGPWLDRHLDLYQRVTGPVRSRA